ncbi:low molecular weight protein-tyrosine-phosphatase [Fructilactobacillus carniphilus]|uniref:protein-tyrosine-phosphatase n=1 Tax=Fructilactobacillus carniphilus TaxID=2940297 RepID=A0ABY5C0K3_9LACO|nr:low molecular weight protein-tyrosine-phosphatase [Fructilactobacillus carniphilus]USS91378.1 low molecular weight phosphotyrosine protein phosphatase [Fructilactobacillus carniphilus]
MAEAMFQRLTTEAGVADQYVISSAATSDEEAGNPPHPGALRTLKNHNLDASNHRSHPLTQADLKNADYIITMDEANLADIQQRLPETEQAKVHLCMDVVPGQAGVSIADPWYTHKFETTYDMLAASLPLWLDQLQQARREASAYE